MQTRRSASAGVRAVPDTPALARTGRLVAGTSIGIVVIMFALSGGVLWTIGLNYDGITGNPASKIHPSTYLTILLFFGRAATSGDPAGFVVRMVRQRPACLLLLAGGLALFVQTLLRKAPGLAGYVDTFMAPALLLMILAELDGPTLRRLEIVVHIIMMANACLGLYEFLSGRLVFPYRFEGEFFAFDTRSTALQGHPLVNALVTAIYVIALISGGGVTVPAFARLPMIGLQTIALVTFGGRSATVVTLLFGCGFLLSGIGAALRRGRVPLLGLATGLILAAIVPLAAIGLAAGGFFDKLAERFVSDGGSANARIQMFDLFGGLALRDLMFGPDSELVDSLRRVNGLELGIENPIVAILLYQGLFLTVVITVGIVLYTIELSRSSGPGTLPAILAFAILINTAQGLASKTTVMSKFAVLIVVLFPPLQRSLSTRLTLTAKGRSAAAPRVGTAPQRHVV